MIIERTVSRMLRPDTMPTVIISVEEGTNCGNVEEILFNRKRKCIDSFVVSKLDENGIPLTEDDVDYVLPFSDLEGMGDYAIIIMRDSVILKKKGQVERKEVYLGKSTLIGDIVVSLKGNKVGTVVDCEFSEEGDISSIFVELTKSEKVERFDAFSVMSIGNGIVIVRTTEQDVSPFKKNDVVQDFVRTKENPEYSYIKHDWNMKSEETDLSVVPAVEQTEASDVEDKADEITQFIPKMEVVKEVETKELSETEEEIEHTLENNLKFHRVVEEESVQNDVMHVENDTICIEEETAQDEVVQIVENSSEIKTESAEEAAAQDEAEHIEEKKDEITVSERRRHPKANQGLVEDNQLIQKFIDKQKVLLLGRVLTRDILDAEGNVLLMKGTKITEDIFDIARQSRKDAIVEMAMFSA